MWKSSRRRAGRSGVSRACQLGATDHEERLGLLAREQSLGFRDLATYASFAEQVKRTKRKLLSFLIAAKDAGKSFVATARRERATLY